MSTKFSTPLRFGFRKTFLQAAILALFGSCTLPVAFAQQSQKDRSMLPRMVLPPIHEPLEPARLTGMEVHARIVGLNAEVTTTLTFLNPNKRVLEGELVFPLPESAGITGYALDIKGQMVDGVVVKKEQARVAFETEVRRGVDPGLVEHVVGNVFRTRVYPLPAGGVRQVRIRYVAPLSIDAKGDAAWHLPMPVGETIGKLGIHVEVSQGAVKPAIGGFGNLRFESLDNIWVAKTELQDAKPGEDVWVALPKLPPQVASVEQTKDGDVWFSLNDLPPDGNAAPSAAVPPPAHIGIAWDASGSRQGDKHLESEIAVLKKLLAAWPDTKVTLLVFRDRPEELREFNLDRDSLLKTLGELAYDGGTDLSTVPGAMDKAGNIDQWLLFTDGLDTLSGRLPDFGKHKLTAVVSQTVADRELLEQACAANGGQVVDLQNMEADAAATAIIHPPLLLTAVHGSGIAEVEGIGQTVHGRATICGKLTGDETELTLEYSNGYKSPPVKIAKSGATSGDLLATVWAGRRIRQLSVRADDNEDELLSLGQRFGIVSPATSLIVMETLDQYIRNDIEPPASLPDMRKMWVENKATQTKVKVKTHDEKLERLLTMWNARVQWWNADYKANRDLNFKKMNEDARTRQAEGEGQGAGGGQAATDNAVPPPAAAVAETPTTPGSTARLDLTSRGAQAAPGLALGGNNTYSGATTVNGGSLTLSPGEAEDQKSAAASSGDLTITIKPWDPATPYLRDLKAADKPDRYATYLKLRKDNESSPAFFLDCAEFFFREGDKEIAIRILTNLAEMKLEDAPLLRVLAWRFEQAGELDRAIVVLRRVLKLRPEEPQSLRDLALALTERGKAKAGSTVDLTEALSLQEKLLFGDWPRYDEIELVVLEEMNALITWIHAQPWDKSPIIPSIDERLLKNLDVDVRIVMSWDADATDVDLHVIEPTGEEAFYSHNRTVSGGLVSHDITQGYGPEEYLMRRALPGTYKIFAHYYGSHQQTVTGPVTVTATVFTNFGRPDEKKEVLTLRLDKVNENAEIGKIQLDEKDHPLAEAKNQTHSQISREDFSALKAGETQQEALRLLGEPAGKNGDLWTYDVGKREYRVQFSKNGTLQSVVEALPGNAKMILVQ